MMKQNIICECPLTSRPRPAGSCEAIIQNGPGGTGVTVVNTKDIFEPESS